MEIFKDIPNYEGLYQISNCGRISSAISQKILKPHLHAYGYHTVCLTDTKGARKYFKIHRLVMLTFRPENQKPQVNHINHVRNDNNLSNLEWVTNAENVRHCVRAGRNAKPPKKKHSIPDDKIREIRQFRGFARDGMKRFGISQTQYHEIRSRNRYAHVED